MKKLKPIHIEIITLQDIADVINSDVDKGCEEIKKYFSTLSKDELERLSFRMALLVSMMPDFLE